MKEKNHEIIQRDRPDNAINTIGKEIESSVSPIDTIIKNEKQNHNSQIKKTLVYIRHGWSEWNEADKQDKQLTENCNRYPYVVRPHLDTLLSTKSDAEVLLTARGIEEARDVGKNLSEFYRTLRPEFFFSSKYFRAIETRKYAIEELETIYGELFPHIKLREFESLNEESSLGTEAYKLQEYVETFLRNLNEEYAEINTVVVFGHRNWYKTFLQTIHNWTKEELIENIQLAKLKNGQIAYHTGSNWNTLRRVHL